MFRKKHARYIVSSYILYLDITRSRESRQTNPYGIRETEHRHKENREEKGKLRMRHWVRPSCPEWKWTLFSKWFAWRPVLVGEYWVWLETIERRDWHGEGITYRDYRFLGTED